jgi:hypothetical protein
VAAGGAEFDLLVQLALLELFLERIQQLVGAEGLAAGPGADRDGFVLRS